ncbi:hypothetical protein G6W61_13415 [Streptomyces sp. KAI-26]|uniref:Syndecan 1 n=2 Tax=Streptomyces TaxID=1883 RepID=A0AAD0QBV8_9ACTN|nr:hypothetical protein DTW94_24745 [Streptomyces cavourensis]NUV87202.1 hypothetical protein [Streptomyces sp. KAI-26]NUW21633.1 hypothetical protein [Streptomyces roseoviolaceus]
MPLPVVPDPAGPPPAGPAPGGDAPAYGPQPLSVRVPPHTPSPALGANGPGATHRQPPTQAQALQRAAAQAGLTGVPVKAVPPRSARPKTIQRSDTTDAADITGTSETTTTETTTPANRITGAELDALARRLIDPVSRLIRADMRRGRERAGRPHEGRR